MERTGEIALRFERDRFAERLRIKKGDPVRVTNWDGSVSDYRVTRVSTPDNDGNVRVGVTAA